VANIDSGVALKAAAQNVRVGAVRLDEDELPRSGALEDEIRYRPDSGAGFNRTTADPVRE